MLPRQIKAAFYFFCAPLMRLNGLIYLRFRASGKTGARLHLGPGKRKYLSGWINVDANFTSKNCDAWLDLRNPLPFKEGSVSAIYSFHMIEHLPDIQTHFKDMFRVLKSGGVIRVGGPHGDNAMKMMLAKDHDWFGDFPDKRRSLGGRFDNFIFCRNEHLCILTESYLKELAEDAGFTDLKIVAPVTESQFPEVFGEEVMAIEEEDRPDMPHTVLIEARKP